MEYLERSYRKRFRGRGMISFPLVISESDLWISVDRESYTAALEQCARELLQSLRNQLMAFIDREPEFARTLKPYSVSHQDPRIVRVMAAAAARAEVGPMAAVAGAVAELVGRGLLPLAQEVMVENGGDIFLRTTSPKRVGIFAGGSPLSNRVGLLLTPQPGGYGICTSSATVGPSLSFGRCDAAVILSPSATLADAVASTLGNAVQQPSDFQHALESVCHIRGVKGAVVIMGEQLGAMGEVELVPLS